MQEPITIAYIGNGKSTNRYHLPYILQRKEKFCVETIWQRRDSSEWNKISGVSYTTDLDSLLQDPRINTVIVTTPPKAHAGMVEKVLKAGKNCVCEKPFMLSVKDTQRMFALAKKQDRMLQCYQNRRFDSDFLTAGKVIESGILGDLYEMEMHFDYFRPEVPEKSERYRREESFVYTHACHTLDQVISLFGTPDRVQYDVRSLLGEGRMNDYFDLDLFYSGLKVSVKSSYFRVKPRNSMAVYGRKGMFVKETPDRQEYDLKHFYLPGHSDFGRDEPSHYGTLTVIDKAGGYREEKVETVPGDYGRYYDALYETLALGKPQLVTEEQTLLQMRIMEEAIRELE